MEAAAGENGGFQTAVEASTETRSVALRAVSWGFRLIGSYKFVSPITLKPEESLGLWA